MTEINYTHSKDIHNMSSAEEILPYVFSILKPHTILDVGCGTGKWLTIAKQLGAIEVKGLEGVDIERSMLTITDIEFVHHDLTTPFLLDKVYDLTICLEVAEHLPYHAAEILIQGLTAHSKFILFSAAIPGQGGQNHINEQIPEYWQRIFKLNNFYPYDILRKRFWDNAKVEWWYKQNMLVYAPQEAASILYNKPEDKVQMIIHPELYQIKISALNQVYELAEQMYTDFEDELADPAILFSIKRLIKKHLKN